MNGNAQIEVDSIDALYHLATQYAGATVLPSFVAEQDPVLAIAQAGATAAKVLANELAPTVEDRPKLMALRAELTELVSKAQIALGELGVIGLIATHPRHENTA